MGIAAIMFGIPAWIVLAIIAFVLIKKAIARFERPPSMKISKYLHPGLLGYASSTSILILIAAIAEDISMGAQIKSLIFAFIFPLIAGASLVGLSVAFREKAFLGWWFSRFGIGFYFCTLLFPITVYIMHKALVYRAALQVS